MVPAIERALNEGRAPWKDIEYRCKDFWIFADSTVPKAGYLCFVPTEESMDNLIKTYQAAYRWGYDGLIGGKWEGFNIVQSVGEVAGQGGLYPHIHMIPRHTGDLDEE